MKTKAAAIQSPMQPLFEASGMQRLDAMTRAGVLCAFDFDGTLAPIVTRPEQASLSDGVRNRLVQLGARTPVAVITGRSVADIRMRLSFEPAYVIGNHGLEGMPDRELQADSYRASCRSWLRQLGNAAAAPGVWIEDKMYSISVHYRLAPNPAEAERRLRSALAALDPAPRIVEGKYLFNLLPANAPGKGSALEQLMEICAASGAIYVGDDVTDEDVFRLARPDILTIRIEYLPDSAAEFFVPEHRDIVRVLDLLIEKLE